MNIIFEHIPKTAGYTIRKYLSSILNEANDKNNWDWENSNYVLSSHHILDKRLESIPDFWKKDSKIFTFVRHPVDRFISTFFFILNEKNDSEFYEGNKILRDKLEIYNNDFSYFTTYCNNYAHEMGAMWLPQSIFIDGVQDITVGRYETLDSDWEKICNLFNIPHIQLPRRNVTNGVKPKIKDIDRYLIQKIENYYEKDMKMFGYESKLYNNK